MNTKYSIEKLTDKNYLVWAVQIELILESKGLWKHVENQDSVSEEGSEKTHREKRQCLAEIIFNIDSKFVATDDD